MAKKEKANVLQIPSFTHGEGGKLRKLSNKDFPKTRAGRLAYCDYRIKKWETRKKVIAERGDPKTKLEKKKQLLAEKLEAVNKELTALGG